MGKTTTAGFFRDEGLAVWDGDASVHRLYAPGAAGARAIAALWPDAVGPTGVDRAALRRVLAADDTALARIEGVIHPLVTEERQRFVATSPSDIVVCDIPLLFETGAEADLDATLLVTAPPALQRRRVMARPGMTEALFQRLLARQMPDPMKRAKADHILETLAPEATRAGVKALIGYLRETHLND
jgi:dephospho-CoA kinase